MSTSVVGFDIGNSTSFIAVAKGGGIETIDNEYSDRCTPSFISFGEKQRFVGASAKQQAITNIKNTIFNFPRLIGKKFSDPAIQKEIPRVPFSIIQLPDDKIGVECQYLGQPVTFSPEQLMAIQLTKLKETTENHLKTPCIDVVINVPSYYTDSERKAILDASLIAGLNCVRLVNDTTACGIAYGLYNKDFPAPDTPPKHVAFVMLGQSNLQVAICAFNNGKLKVLANANDSALGGRDFDFAIYKHLCELIKQKYKLDVPSNKKATIRLLQECEKLKKLMSANSTKIPLNIECFMEDKDVTCHIERSEFVELIADELTRLEQVLERCISLAKLKPANVSLVELVGGSTRIPVVKSIIQKVFGTEGRTTLNSDEAVARGCALQAAICSPAFKVRDFSVTDACPYAIRVVCQGQAEPYSVDLFPFLHHIPTTRQIEIKRNADFEIQAVYAAPETLPNKNEVLGHFLVKNVRVPEGREKAQLQLKLRMNRHGILNFSSAQLVEPYREEVEVDMTAEEMAAQQPAAEDPAKMDVDQKAEDKNANPEKPAATEAEEQAPKKKPQQQPMKKKVIKYSQKLIDLPIDLLMATSLTEAELNLLKERECEMIQNDRLERDRSNAKNALEEYIYDMRDRLCGSLEKFVLPEDREKFSAELTRMEDWLYDEGEDLPKQPYLDHLSKLRGVGDPYMTRFREAEMRPSAFRRLTSALITVEKSIESYSAGEDRLNHLTAEEIGRVQKSLEEARLWFDQKSNAQNATAPTDMPAVYCAEIEQRVTDFVNATTPILTKKKPAPKKEPAPAAAENGTDKNRGAQGEANSTQEEENGAAQPEKMDASADPTAAAKPEADTMDLD